VLGMLKAGDFVIMQIGHNDNGSPTNPPPGRAAIKGVGDEAMKVTDASGKVEEVHSFGWYLKKYIADARAKGATPIVCSLVPRKIWKDGKIVRATSSYAGWSQEAAETGKASWLDLNELIAQKYDELGPEKVENLFADEHTHTSAAGAELTAECVAEWMSRFGKDPLGFALKP
jgi:lysophospholipase L1-like esterase